MLCNWEKWEEKTAYVDHGCCFSSNVHLYHGSSWELQSCLLMFVWIACLIQVAIRSSNVFGRDDHLQSYVCEIWNTLFDSTDFFQTLWHMSDNYLQFLFTVWNLKGEVEISFSPNISCTVWDFFADPVKCSARVAVLLTFSWCDYIVLKIISPIVLCNKMQ